MSEEELKAKMEEEEKIKQKMSKLAKKKYLEEKENLEKGAYTSFGKLILAKEKTAPQFSFTGANRNAATGDLITIPKNTPGPKYVVSDRLKYSKSPQWKIGTAMRPPIYQNEKFEFYHHEYDEALDYSKQPKKWNKTVGGAMTLDPRIKYKVKEDNPGPGRYDPNPGTIKPKQPAYYLGEKSKFNSLNLQVGTSNIVGPGHYKVHNSKKTSIHTDFPVVSIGKSERKGLNNRIWTKNETYEIYSSVGDQARSKKLSMPKHTLGKANREVDKKLGIFPSHMSKQPTRVRIEHPKIY